VIHSYIALRLARRWNVPAISTLREKLCQRGSETYPQCTASLTNIFRILGLSLSDGELDSQQTVPQFSRLVHIHHHFRQPNGSFE
jgi:hypothetical protein